MTPAATAAKVRDAIDRFAPVWVSPPLLQPARFYLEWLGEDLRARAFLTPSEDGHDLCLRPDMTAPACRVAFASNPAPAAVAYEGLVFRRQAPGSGKETEFLQVGLECLASPPDEATLIAACLEAARACNIAAELRVGHMAVMDAILSALDLHPLWASRLRAQIRRGVPLNGAAPAAGGHALTHALMGLSADEAGAALQGLYDAAGITPVGSRPAAAIAARLQDQAALAKAPAPSAAALGVLTEALKVNAPVEAAVLELGQLLANPVVIRRAGADAALAAVAEQWRALCGLVDAPPCRFSPGFGRTVSIYDGFLFELEAPALGPRASLGGGGRYDALAQAVARDMGRGDAEGWRACGFALRPARLAEAAQ
jgi:ATP phosphoribosyltransferase regulatory subunit